METHLTAAMLCRAARAGQLDLCFKSTPKTPHSHESTLLLALWSDVTDCDEEVLVETALAAFNDERYLVI